MRRFVNVTSNEEARGELTVAGSTGALLMTTHLVAAAIVVPASARRPPYGPDERLRTTSGRSHPC